MSISGGPDIIENGLVLYLDSANPKNSTLNCFVAVQIYSVYNGGLRSANYTVQYSDNNSTWTTAFTGVMSNNSQCGIQGGSGVGSGTSGFHRYWRYVEGSAVASHHPRCSRIDLIDIYGNACNLVTYVSDNCSDTGTYIVGTVSKDYGTPTLSDFSGNGYNGTLTNGPTFSSASKGGVVFDGVDDYISIPHNTNLNLMPITICSWINVNGTNTGGEIFNKYYSSSVNGYRLYAAYGAGIQIYYFYGAIGNGLASYDSYSGTFAYTGWHHICCTVNSTGAILYLNAASVGTRSWAGSSGATTTTQNISIGNYPPTSNYFNGRISNVQIYNRALSSNEILQNYNSIKGRYNL